MHTAKWVPEVVSTCVWGDNKAGRYVSDGTKGLLVKFTQELTTATLYITHCGAVVEPNIKWDVGLRLHGGGGFDRIFAGQPLHDSPEKAMAWCARNRAKIERAIMDLATPTSKSRRRTSV